MHLDRLACSAFSAIEAFGRLNTLQNLVRLEHLISRATYLIYKRSICVAQQNAQKIMLQTQQTLLTEQTHAPLILKYKSILRFEFILNK